MPNLSRKMAVSHDLPHFTPKWPCRHGRRGLVYVDGGGCVECPYPPAEPKLEGGGDHAWSAAFYLPWQRVRDQVEALGWRYHGRDTYRRCMFINGLPKDTTLAIGRAMGWWL